MGFGGASSWSTDVSTWGVGASCASLKFDWVAVDPPLDSEDDSLGLKPKLTREGVRDGRTSGCSGKEFNPRALFDGTRLDRFMWNWP